ncbi:uroporphyrinogen decarboxylase [Myxococcota bacterium]|nr:uroporphyrinogen decarboxylase [Myxococcota bacterium]
MRLIDACRGRPVDTTPVWVMRQAGRYLPEYRELRRGLDFLDFCKRPDLLLEAALQPLRRYDLDAAILFSDILLPLEPMGIAVHFHPEPRIPDPIRAPADLARIRDLRADRDLPFVMQAVADLRAALPRDKALFGFCGAPLTLALYLVEGGGSRDFLQAKALMFREPDLFRRLLDLLADAMGEYLAAQVHAGADVVQVFDSWAGVLTPQDYEAFALPAARRLIARARSAGAPVVYFVNGVAPLVEAAATAGADVLGVDHRVRLSDVVGRLGPGAVVQGNLDPAVLLGPPETIRERAAAVVEEGRAAAGHVFNLGHGITRETPPENVAVLVEAVHQAGQRRD